MDKLDFCPNCGAKLSDGDDFCPECGFDLKKYLKENQTNEQEPTKEPETKNETQPIQAKQPSQPAQPRPTQNENAPLKPNKKNKGIMPFIIIIIVLIAAYFAGNVYFSEARQTQSLETKVTSGNVAQMKNALVDKDGNQISNENIDSLKRLFNKNSSATREVENQIDQKQSGSTFSLVKNGRYLLLYPKYKVQINDKELSVETNISNPIFYIDGKNVAAKSSNGEYTISNLTPGVYDLKIKNSNKASEAKEKQVTVGIDTSYNDETMNVKKTAKKTPVKTITRTIVKHDRNTSADTDTDDDDDDSSSSNSDSSIIGSYSGDPDLSLYSDGTYDLGDKTGTYTIVENNNGHVRIRYDQDGGGSITESYDYDNGVLHSSKYDTEWVKN